MSHTDTQTIPQLRTEIDRLLSEGLHLRAQSQMHKLWCLAPDGASAGFINQRASQLRGKVPLTACRVALLRSFTVEPMVPMMKAGALVGGIDVEAHIGEFNSYVQEVLDPGSPLYAFKPSVIFLAVQGSDLASDLYQNFGKLDARSVGAIVEQTINDLNGWIALLRERTNATIVVHNFEVPETASAGLLDAQILIDLGRDLSGSCQAGSPESGKAAASSQADAIRRINRGLADAARQHPGVHMLDYDALTSRHGKRQWFDARKWLMVRLPITAPNLAHMAAEWTRFLHPAAGKLIKCLVCDLDNTLWGGVIGEDGMTGIKVDGEYPGAAFVALQRGILDMHDRGVILAINSKNNHHDAMEAIRDHPRMLLRPEHFAALRINWQDKATNLRQIAQELNIGVDSLAFIDDNPVERQWVRENAPEVTVIELPADPMLYAQTLRNVPGLERLSLSAEDKVRGRFYAEDRMRDELRTSVGSMADFYRSLSMVAEIGSVTGETLPRVSQLTQKTNQFNLSTRRYNEAEVQALASGPDSRVFWMRVSDRFGDNGLIAVAILRFKDKVCEIDTYLMSCRVIGRGVETGLLAFLADEARRAGCTSMRADYVVTKKNAPVKDFLPQHRFSQVLGDDQNGTWELALPCALLGWPEYIELHSAPPGYTPNAPESKKTSPTDTFSPASTPSPAGAVS